jgi:hypothetical protein
MEEPAEGDVEGGGVMAKTTQRWVAFQDTKGNYLGLGLYTCSDGIFPAVLKTHNRSFKMVNMGSCGQFAIPTYRITQPSPADHQGERG